eukprot:1196437-Pyramimonas_sp.AAC.1
MIPHKRNQHVVRQVMLHSWSKQLPCPRAFSAAATPSAKQPSHVHALRGVRRSVSPVVGSALDCVHSQCCSDSVVVA